jgi:hypothetical protein
LTRTSVNFKTVPTTVSCFELYGHTGALDDAHDAVVRKLGEARFADIERHAERVVGKGIANMGLTIAGGGAIVTLSLTFLEKDPCSAIARALKFRFAARPFTRRLHLPLARSRIALRLYRGLMPFAGRTASCLTRWTRQRVASRV